MSVIQWESDSKVWCRDCGEIRPMTLDCIKADELNDHDATDILCDRHHVVATIHHPKAS